MWRCLHRSDKAVVPPLVSETVVQITASGQKRLADLHAQMALTNDSPHNKQSYSCPGISRIDRKERAGHGLSSLVT